MFAADAGDQRGGAVIDALLLPTDGLQRVQRAVLTERAHAINTHISIL
jgi:hypothetical protein